MNAAPGWSPPPSLPPVHAARWLAEREPAAGPALEALAWLHYRVGLGGEPDAALASEAEALVRTIEAALRPPNG